MLINARKSWHLSETDVTDHDTYINRRRFMRQLGAGAAAFGLAGCGVDAQNGENDQDPTATQTPGQGGRLTAVRNDAYASNDSLTSYQAVTGYNNFYEFGTGKDDPAENAHSLKSAKWTVSVEGAVERPGTYGLEDLVDFNALEERIYRLRCVETWSMVIPWIGVPLSGLLAKVRPTERARYVQFETLADPSQMPGLRYPVLDWPYVEGLRLDEAMNPLTFIAVGLYGQVLPNQNGAPLRLVVPWKYGFKSIKSIVAMRLVDRQPATSWNRSQPREYGFYANVNPEVSHPRWSQAQERRIGEFRRRDTLMFNGYGEEVAHLYQGMDLAKYF